MEAETLKSTADRKPFKFSSLLDPANFILTAAVIIALVFLVGLSRENSRLKERGTDIVGSIAGAQTAEVGDIVPSFSTINLEGHQTEIKYDDSKVHLLYIFSPDCRVCVEQFPVWSRIASRAYSENYSVHSVSLSSLDSTREYFEGKNIDSNLGVVLMPNQAVLRAYRVVSIPQIMLVSKQGVVDWVHYGALKDTHISELFPR